MKITEALPDDGAPYKCQHRNNNPPDYICGEKATCGLTKEAFGFLNHIFRMRAVCSQHAVEAEIELQNLLHIH